MSGFFGGGASQPIDSDLTAIAALSTTAFGRSLLDDADAAAALTTLGVSAFAQTLLDDANAATARTTLGVAHRGALVTKSVDQTTADYTAGAVIAWDSEAYDTDAIHNPADNTKLSVPSGVTKVRLTYGVLMSSVTGASDIFTVLRKNGSDAFVGTPAQLCDTSNTSPRLSATSPILAVVGGTDYFEVHMSVAGDSSITVAANYSWFAMEIIE